MVICLGLHGTVVVRRARTRRAVGTSSTEAVEFMVAVVPEKLADFMESVVPVLRKISHTPTARGSAD